MLTVKKRIKLSLKRNFGVNPLESLFYYDASDRIDKVEQYHNALCEDKNINMIDNITWEDLEMNEIFLRINHTESFIGEQVLFNKLHNLSGSEEESVAFENRLSFWDANENKRVDVQAKLFQLGKSNNSYKVIDFLKNAKWLKMKGLPGIIFLQIVLICCILGAIITKDSVFTMGLVFSCITNFVVYMGIKNKYQGYIDMLAIFANVYELAISISKDKKLNQLLMNTANIKALEELKGMSKAILAIKIRNQNTISGDMIGLIYEYIAGVTLIDFNIISYAMKNIENKFDKILQLLEFVGEIDAEIAVLSYRQSLNYWCRPEFDSDNIEMKGFAHPLIEEAVTNDFVLADRAIITGANATGKSTFMKAFAINCILAQTIYTCIASEVAMQRIRVMTCMSLRDDVISGESYYYREAKYLKRMLDLADSDMHMLCVIDEILKGTNTRERIAASKAILDYLSRTGDYVLIATHDRELTETSAYKKYFFESLIKDGDIFFDHKIHEGISDKTNAIELLELLGYPNFIVNKARENAV